MTKTLMIIILGALISAFSLMIIVTSSFLIGDIFSRELTDKLVFMAFASTLVFAFAGITYCLFLLIRE